MTEQRVQPPQGHQRQNAPPAETTGFAVASRECGILGVVFPFIPSIPSPLAVIFAGRKKRQIDGSGGLQTGRGLAVAGQIQFRVGIAPALVATLPRVGRFAAFSVGRVGGVDAGPLRDSLK